MSGWWWISSSPAPTSPEITQSQPTKSTTIPPPTSPTPSPTGTKFTPPQRTPKFAGSQSGEARLDQLNRDEDAALEEFAAAFSESRQHPTSLKPSTNTSTETKQEPDYDEELYTTYLSCSACFDQAYYCSSVGGQLNNLYRYGALRSCSELWVQWRFCMRTKTMGEEERKKRIWEWNREKEARKRLGRSSEEVWGVKARALEEQMQRD